MVRGAVCVFAKCPIPGRSKTRIAPLLGENGAACLAMAMLSDILVSLTKCEHLQKTLKVLVYAPGSNEGELHMKSILQSLDLSITSIHNGQSIFDGWILLPMASEASKADLTSTSLGSKLEDALDKTRQLLTDVQDVVPSETNNQSVLFLGMDAPEVPLEEIAYGLNVSSMNKAHMCPADDGGYGLLSVPREAPSSQIFSGVRWSNKLTAVSQLKALSDCNIGISIGKMMHDIDEPDDVLRLARRLMHSRNSCSSQDDSSGSVKDDVLELPSSGIRGNSKFRDANTFNVCQYTWEALLDLNMITRSKDGCFCLNSDCNNMER